MSLLIIADRPVSLLTLATVLPQIFWSETYTSFSQETSNLKLGTITFAHGIPYPTSNNT